MKAIMKKDKKKIDLFLDSGAYSAFSQGAKIDIYEYINFIKEHEKHLSVYANLDVIGDPIGTWENQVIMESEGLTPLPCYHYGENIKWLKKYLKKYDYIALGGMVPVSTKNLRPWLDTLFSDYLCDSTGMPIAKIHGFGMTSLRLMLRYPWYSVDSTSWVMTGRMGAVYVPIKRGGVYDYKKEPLKIPVSSKSPKLKEKNKHISTLSKKVRKTVLEYIHKKGYKLGESVFKEVDSDRKLKDNEKWAEVKSDKETRLVEIIKKRGLCNDYKLRDELNIQYFQDLEDNLPKWPWAFKTRSSLKGFGL